jgi:hypothetical protein
MIQTPLPAPMGDSVWIRVLEWVLSMGGGVLAALVTFRLRLGNMDNKLTAHEKEIDRVRSDYVAAITSHKNDVSVEAIRAERAFRDALDSLRKESDTRHTDNLAEFRKSRRQNIVMLGLLADIARKVQVEKRYDDAIAQFLSEEIDG